MPNRNNPLPMNAALETAVLCDEQRKSVFVVPKLTFVVPKLVKQGSVKQLTNTEVTEDSL